MFSLQKQYEGGNTLIWADGTDGTSRPTPTDIMAHITASFTPSQLNSVKKVGSPADIPFACPQNFNFLSECFAAIAFNDIPANTSSGRPVNYTIRADAGLAFIDVGGHTSDFEKRILPLQWAIDQVSLQLVLCMRPNNLTRISIYQAIIELKTGVKLPTPQEWPYTKETNEEQATHTRLSMFKY